MEISRSIDITIWMTPFKKRFPNPGQVIEFGNINSGSTDGVTIDIWRQEESDKVLVHEAIHLARAHGRGINQKTRKDKPPDEGERQIKTLIVCHKNGERSHQEQQCPVNLFTEGKGEEQKYQENNLGEKVEHGW